MAEIGVCAIDIKFAENLTPTERYFGRNANTLAIQKKPWEIIEKYFSSTIASQLKNLKLPKVNFDHKLIENFQQKKNQELVPLSSEHSKLEQSIAPPPNLLKSNRDLLFASLKDLLRSKSIKLNPNQKTVLMVVINGVEGDSRVIKSAQSLINNGFNVVLCGITNIEGFAKVKTISDINALLIDRNKIKLSEAVSSDDFFQAFNKLTEKIVQFSQKLNFDILYTHDYTGIHVGFNIVSKVYQVKRVEWIHDVHEFVAGYRGVIPDGRVDYGIEIERKLLLCPDTLIFVNEKIRDAHLGDRQYMGKNFVVYNTPRQQIDSKFCCRHASKLGNDQLVGVYVGRATYKRGIDIVIPLLEGKQNLHICLLSSHVKSDLLLLEEQAKKSGVLKRLHIFPYVPDNQVIAAIKRCDFGLSPLLDYGNANLAVPTKIMEYIHAGLPILAANTDLQKEFVNSHQIGVTYRVGDAADACSAFDRLLEKRTVYAKNCKYVASIFSWEDQYKPVIKYLQGGEFRKNLIFEGPGKSAGQPYELAKTLRSLGVDALSVDISINQGLSHKTDINFQTPNLNKAQSLTLWASHRFDRFHYHFRPIIRYIEATEVLAPTMFDLTFLRSLGKKIIFQFRGSEARLNSKFSKLSPYSWNEAEDPFGYPDSVKERLIVLARECSHLLLVPDPELQTYVPDAKILQRAIDAKQFTPQYSVGNPVPVIVHAPSRRAAKGTEQVISTIEKLKNKGFQFEFKLLENMTHAQCISELEKADIVIDQLRIGWYGVLTVEAMALGKSALVYIREDLVSEGHYNAPACTTTIEKLEDDLAELIQDSKLRTDIGKRSRKYVEEYHDSVVVCRKLITYFDEIDQSRYFFTPQTLLNQTRMANLYISLGRKTIKT